jgi:hypothetical protein
VHDQSEESSASKKGTASALPTYQVSRVTRTRPSYLAHPLHQGCYQTSTPVLAGVAKASAAVVRAGFLDWVSCNPGAMPTNSPALTWYAPLKSSQRCASGGLAKLYVTLGVQRSRHGGPTANGKWQQADRFKLTHRALGFIAAVVAPASAGKCSATQVQFVPQVRADQRTETGG